jgi:hypothetical protein
MKETKERFTTVKILNEDHDRIVSRVTHTTKIYNIVTLALDALERQEAKRK